MKEFWMSKYAMFDIYIFQHREDLFGFSYASLLVEDPDEFKRIFDSEVS